MPRENEILSVFTARVCDRRARVLARVGIHCDLLRMRLAAAAAAVIAAVALGAALWLHRTNAAFEGDCSPSEFSRELYCRGAAGQPCGQQMRCGTSHASAARCFWERQSRNETRGSPPIWKPPSSFFSFSFSLSLFSLSHTPTPLEEDKLSKSQTGPFSPLREFGGGETLASNCQATEEKGGSQKWRGRVSE